MKQQTITDKDIFTINDNVNMDEFERIISCFTIKGKEEFIDEDKYPRTHYENNVHTHAKRVNIGDSTRYYIKFSNTGRIFNPYGLYDENQRIRQSRHAARPNWKWTQVSEKVFSSYIDYLKTRNSAYLINAEREIL